MNTATSQWLLFDIERLKRIFRLVKTDVSIADRIRNNINLLIGILLSLIKKNEALRSKRS